MRPYGIRVYLSANFAAPRSPRRPADAPTRSTPRVARWWKAKADEIYRLIPDFGGFLVKANSEGQPGPQDYGRTHADGANVLADAVAPHGGIVMWRAFVYDADVDPDRVKRAYLEFVPLDGKFRDNVIVQVKNGPLDFQPREPFHPLFGAMPKTPLMAELQITQEYLGHSNAPRVPGADVEGVPRRRHVTRSGPGSTVAKVIDGTRRRYRADRHRRRRQHRPRRELDAATISRRPTGTPSAGSRGTRISARTRIADEWIRMTWGARAPTPSTASAR